MYMHTYVHMYMYTYMHIYMHTNMHMYIYKHKYMHAHVHTLHTILQASQLDFSTPPPHLSYICHMTLCACAVVLYPRIIPLFSEMTKKSMPR
jgi:hypothetical protein